AKYEMRYATPAIAWGSAAVVTQGTCSAAASGPIGNSRSCTVTGLSSSTAYQFQLVPYRGTLNVDAVFAPLSNLASGSTTLGADTTPPVVGNGAPAGALAAGTTQTTISVTTNEAATCKYGGSDASYAALPYTFSSTGGTS